MAVGISGPSFLVLIPNPISEYAKPEIHTFTHKLQVHYDQFAKEMDTDLPVNSDKIRIPGIYKGEDGKPGMSFSVVSDLFSSYVCN